MIQANELRIGNTVMLKNGEQVEVEMIWDGGINEDSSYGDAGDFNLAKYREEEIYPIPLTPEILEKCGLVETEKSFSSFLSHFILCGCGGHLRRKGARWIIQEIDGTILKVPFLRIDGITDVYYLHQLQNLFFALTGEELIINL